MTDPQLAADVDACCRPTGEFTLRAGRGAPAYSDRDLFESDPRLLARVVAQMADLLPEGTELLGGLELGGGPIVTPLRARGRAPAPRACRGGRWRARGWGRCSVPGSGCARCSCASRRRSTAPASWPRGLTSTAAGSPS